MDPRPAEVPPSGTVERAAWDYVTTRSLTAKVEPPPPPAATESDPPARRIAAPGRPPELDVVAKSRRSMRRGELRDPSRRARLLHTFWHHELQAAELFCYARLAFPTAPAEFRDGLMQLWSDEVRHMRMYQARIEALGHGLGDFPVRDWFWTRVPQCRSPLEFVALMGLGLEGGNLDHAARFTDWLADAGDPESAAVQATVGREEIAHVRFAARWFREWTGGLEFDAWREALTPPLTPALFRGRPIAAAPRRAAGLPDSFVKALAAWSDPA